MITSINVCLTMKSLGMYIQVISTLYCQSSFSESSFYVCNAMIGWLSIAMFGAFWISHLWRIVPLAVLISFAGFSCSCVRGIHTFIYLFIFYATIPVDVIRMTEVLFELNPCLPWRCNVVCKFPGECSQFCLG